MKIARAVLEYLKVNQVEYIFGIPAGTVSPLYDALNDVNIPLIVAKNEGGAAYMAARYASVTNRMGVCMAAGGVGVNNMINGIADAMRAKAPLLVITGYVHRWQIGKGALQELDTEEILKPITKYSKTILDEKQVMDELENAIKLANTVPKGPVHLSIPIDIQLTDETMEISKASAEALRNPVFDENLFKDVIRVIGEAEKGLILVGKGCRDKGDLVMKLSSHLQWPIITTPEGKGVVPSEFPLNLGNYGFASTDAASEYVASGNANCLLVLGSSLGEIATNNFNPVLFEGKTSIHIDWDEKELGKVFPTDYKIKADLVQAITYILNNTEKYTGLSFDKPVLNHGNQKPHTGLSLKEFLEKLPEVMPNETYYVSDLGEFMNFVFKFLPIPEGGDFEINLNYAAMGSGIAGAIGVQAANPGRQVAVFAGDGSFFMNGTEILTAKEYGLPIIYFIINNAMLGFVEHGHEFLFGRVVKGFKQQRINIADMMGACGIKTMQINQIEQMQNIPEFIKDLKEPAVIELITDGSEASPNGDRLKALQKH